jgi:hypothetical protein
MYHNLIDEKRKREKYTLTRTQRFGKQVALLINITTACSISEAT